MWADLRCGFEDGTPLFPWMNPQSIYAPWNFGLLKLMIVGYRWYSSARKIKKEHFN